MHEEVLLQDLVRKVDEVARQDPSARVTRVRVWIGALSHLSEAFLRESWPRVTAGTAADASQLVIEVSRDVHHPRADSVVLVSLDVADEERDTTGPEAASSTHRRLDSAG